MVSYWYVLMEMGGLIDDTMLVVKMEEVVKGK